MILAASSARTAVAETAQTLGEMPAEASLTIDSQSSKYVSAVSYSYTDASEAAVIAVAKGDTRIEGKNIVLSGTIQTNGQVVWVCGGSIDSKYRPASCR